MNLAYFFCVILNRPAPCHIIPSNPSVLSPNRAHVGMPDGAYISPWVMMFVPSDISQKFKDASTCHNTSWLWTFDDTDIATNTLQNPTVIS